MLPINWLGRNVASRVPRSHNVFTPANLGSPAPTAPVKSFYRGGDLPARKMPSGKLSIFPIRAK